MYHRSIIPQENSSFFLFGPRGVGKSTWVKQVFPDAMMFDLLNQSLFQELLRNPSLLEARILAAQTPGRRDNRTVIVDEIQRLPDLLNEVHRLIEEKNLTFVLTGSSARKLRRSGSNLLAGRARRLEMYPLTAQELGQDFQLEKSLKVGHLPTSYLAPDPLDYLKSYVGTYLREEVQQEALVRNLATFSNFLELAAYSQAAVLSVQSIARDCGVDRKTAESYFVLLEDLLLAIRLPVFQKKAKRKMTVRPKFYYFDVGVYRALRKTGPLDMIEEIEGPALETLVFQEIRATNANLRLGYDLSFWRTRQNDEVDFVLYGPRGLIAIEVKRSQRVRGEDLETLKLFLEDYPQAKAYLLYGGSVEYVFGNIRVLPIDQALRSLVPLLSNE